MNDRFVQVGIRETDATKEKRKPWHEGKPLFVVLLLGVVVIGCIFCEAFIPKDPTYMDLYNGNLAPSKEFWFGTDTMGRDIFSMIWYGGRVSLLIGVISTAISTVIAILFGAVSGMSPKWLDDLLMRVNEIILSVPGLLIIVLLQAILGKANVLSISLVIGITGWTSIAKVVRSEVRQIRNSEYVIAAKCSGAGFFHILWKHLTPNFLSSIMFMVVMNVRSAIVAESTLSFMGMGLPLEEISWGSMLSLADGALFSGSWWIIVIPGAFLVVTLLCVTELGNYLRKNVSQRESVL
ncbi:MAG: ABC transporter permease [Lachnospiraceae bacterium]|nr:ABC transporter permease [Lachnospiraceae bacterium]